MFLINKNLKKAQNKEKIIHTCYRSYKKKVGTILFLKKNNSTIQKKYLPILKLSAEITISEKEEKGESL